MYYHIICCVLHHIIVECYTLLSRSTRARRTQLHIALPDSKGAKRLGRPESVMLKQPHIVQFIAKAVDHMEPSEFIFKGTHASLGRAFGGLLAGGGGGHLQRHLREEDAPAAV